MVTSSRVADQSRATRSGVRAGSAEAGDAEQLLAGRPAGRLQHQDRGVMEISAEDVFMGNGVSECIDFALRALLNSGDEILVPSPDEAKLRMPG